MEMGVGLGPGQPHQRGRKEIRALPPPHHVLASLLPMCSWLGFSPSLAPEAHPNLFPHSVPMPSSPPQSPHHAWCQGPGPQLASPS